MNYLLYVLLLTAPFLIASDEVIVLSPFTIDDSRSSNRYPKPPIVLRKTADFYALEIQLTNDSRLLEQRRNELHETILNLLKRARVDGKVELHNGQNLVDESNYMLPVIPLPGKSDTSYLKLLVKVPLGDKDSVTQLKEKLEDFISNTEMVGRTYFEYLGSALTIKNPEQYRMELIEKIAEDINAVDEAFGGEMSFSINNLDDRMTVSQSSERTVDLYILYSFTMETQSDD